MSMQLAAMRLVFRIHDARSLKDKRRVSNRIRDRVAARFNVSVAEVEDLDEHRRLVIGVAMVANDAPFLRSTMDRITGFIEQLYVAELVDRVRDSEQPSVALEQPRMHGGTVLVRVTGHESVHGQRVIADDQ